MKKFLLLALTIFAFSSVKAQDLVVLKNADEIQVKVISITPDSVTYKKWSNLEGPTYTIPSSNVFYIKYQNGEKEVMYEETIQEGDSKSKKKNNSTSKIPIKFQGYLFGGIIFDSTSIGPTFDITLGSNVGNYIYIGVETGFYTSFDQFTIYDIDFKTFGAYIPLGGNIKVFCMRNRPISPFFNCSLGGFWGVAGVLKNGISGFCCQVGAGIEANEYSFTMGYSPLVATTVLGIPLRVTAHCGYVKIGVRF